MNADGSTESGSLIDEIVREGARRIPAAAPEAEANRSTAELAAETDEAGRRLVVRNSHHRPRTVITAAGPVEVTAPHALAPEQEQSPRAVQAGGAADTDMEEESAVEAGGVRQGQHPEADPEESTEPGLRRQR
ncbi:hypothetical protein [Streptomyces sp. NPDC008092]|uniref:hypothetical protein n=1 Tax=Streptomyces sp. NPDC008092 TaxID=3364808 RepID=UPI0036E22C2E